MLASRRRESKSMTNAVTNPKVNRLCVICNGWTGSPKTTTAEQFGCEGAAGKK